VPVVGTNAVRVSQRVFSSLKVTWAFPNKRNDAATGTLIPPRAGLAHGRVVELDIVWEAKGGGTTYQAGARIEADPLFLACGCGLTVVPAPDSLVYAQADTGHASCTIYAYANGSLYKIVGCRGAITTDWKAGTLGMVRFKMYGLLVADPPDVALPGGFVYQAQEPLAGVAFGLGIGGWTPSLISCGFDQGVKPERLDSMNATDGVEQYDYGDALPTFKVSAKTPATLAVYNPYTDPKARTARAIATVYGSVQFNRMKFNVTSAMLDTHGHADQQKFTAYDLQYDLQDWNFTFD
jgi:hypothetical protein